MHTFGRSSVLAVLCLFVAGVASGQTFTAQLGGLQEVPPNPSPGTGSATLVLDAGMMLQVTCTFGGLLAPVTAAHIHAPAPPGVNAGVRFSLIPPAPPVSPINLTVGPLTAAQAADLINGLSYINIHTGQFPGGEIRGQIRLETVAVDSGTWGQIKTLFN